ncbi:hypothetical protein KE530_10025 [Clostridiaceae bacterium Marseille-Q4145]|nr:hypothetical protein [Clostridiaceae bacterium Marseille-Q4145]
MRRNRNLPWRIIDSCLIVSLLAAQPNVAAYAAEGSDPGIVSITSEDDFVLLTENCKTESFSTGKTFRLDADLDLSNYENLFLPVMDGTFDGNGHQIIGVTLSEEMSDYGLFRYVTANGVVKNLTVEGEILGGDEQENIGILAGSNAGAIENCITRGTLNAETAVGGITGKNEETGSVSRSENEAAIDGKMQTGGIAGLNEGSISDCVNSGKINTNQKIKKQAEGDGSSVNISIPNAVTGLTADERANETGGIAGNSSGDISYCTNTATIGFERLGSSTGGIVGRQLGSLSYCANKGVVYGHKNVGGISGVLEPYEESSYDRDYRQELSDELDRLGDLIDDVSNQGEKLGDNLSDNADLLSDQLKTLRNSLRGYMDDYSDMASDGKDAIHDNVKSMKKTIDGMQYDVKIKQLNTAIEQISNDIAQMEKIMEQLKPYVDQGNAKLDGLFKQYEEKIQGWIDSIDDLKQYQENLPEEAPDEVTPAAPSQNEIVTGGSTTDEAQKNTDADSDTTEDTTGSGSQASSTDTGSSDNGDASDTGDSGKNSDSTDETTSTDAAVDNTTNDQAGSNSDESTSDSDNSVGSDDSSEQGTSGDSNSGSDSSPDSKSSSESDGNDQASTGRMIPVAYRVVTSTTLPDGTQLPDVNIPDVQVPSELTAALQQLQALSKDVRTQMSTIAGLLGEMPGQTNQLMSDIKSITGSMDKMTDELDDILDDFDDEMDTMRDDLRQKGNNISDTLDNTSDTLHADFDGVRDSLDRVKDQFDVIRGTVSDALDELKNRIDDKSVYVDVSELTDATSGDGKIISSTNSGEVYADTQGGGIAGAIVKTNPQKAAAWFFQDKNDDEDDDEDESDGITRHLLAAVFSSSNTADITVKGDYAGGIVGKADYGIIVAGENYGDILADGGKYAGGIAGRCDNTIRDSYVLSGVSGDGYVGGVAGRGEDISGNYVCSYLDMDSYVKSSGAVVGKADGVVKDNYFVDNGYGAVDGVTRSSEAESMDYDSLIQLGNMPLNFTQFTVRFMNGEQVVWQNTFAYGEELPEENYPDLPKSKDGYVYWEEKDVSPIHRNVTVHAVYRAYMPALTADAEAEKSPVLMGGEFYPDTKISVREATDEELAQVKANIDNDSPFYKYYLKKVYYYEVSQAQPLRTNAIVRVLNDTRLADSLMTMDAEYQTVGEAQKADTIGSYLSSDTQISSAGYIVVLNRMDIWVEILISAAVLALAILVVVGLHIRRQKRRNAAKAAAEAAVTKETDDETVKPEE